MKSKKKKNLFSYILLAGITIVCLALIWAGLHDVMKGEENITAEIIAVSGSAVVLMYVIFRFFRVRTHN